MYVYMTTDDIYQAKRIVKYFHSKNYDDFSFQELNNLIVFRKNSSNVKGFYCTKKIFDMVVDLYL